MRPTEQRRPGIKLFELLVIAAMVGFVLLLLPPGLYRWRGNADRTECANRLKKIAAATHAIHQMNGALPPLAAATNDSDLSTLKGPYQTEDRGYTLFVWLLPYLQAEAPFRQVTSSGDVTSDTARTVWNFYLCPADWSSPYGRTPNGDAGDVRGYAVGNYLANYLIFGDPKTGSLAGEARIPSTFIDGTSNTIMFAEGYGTCGPGGGSLWADIDLSNDKPYSYLPAMCVASAGGFLAPKGNPGQLYVTDGGVTPCSFAAGRAIQNSPSVTECAPGAVQTMHSPEGGNIALADASVRFFSSQISTTCWNRVCDPRDGLPFSGDW